VCTVSFGGSGGGGGCGGHSGGGDGGRFLLLFAALSDPGQKALFGAIFKRFGSLDDDRSSSSRNSGR
jgi:hypothetical protein